MAELGDKWQEKSLQIHYNLDGFSISKICKCDEAKYRFALLRWQLLLLQISIRISARRYRSERVMTANKPLSWFNLTDKGLSIGWTAAHTHT